MNAPFAHSDFRRYWAARLCAMLAHNALVMALGWSVYDIARASLGVRAAALRLGLMGLAQFLPILLCNPVAGLMADRNDRRVVVRLAMLGQLAAIVPLALAAAHGAITLATLYLVAVGFAAARAFYMPAMNALLSATVPAPALPRAIALGAIAGRIGGIMGPLLGGYAYAVSPGAAYGFACALLVVSLGFQLAISPAAGRQRGASGHPLALMREGLAYLRGHPLLLGVISLDLVATLLGGVTALLPVYARDVLHIGPGGLGLLRAASSMGALGMAVAASLRPVRREVGGKMLIAVGVYGVSTVVFGLSTSLLLSMACLALLGAADMLSALIRQTLIQISTPDAMRGRVGAITSLSVVASNELGEMESGVAAALLGPVGAVVAGGLASIAVALVWARLFPPLLEARDFGPRPVA